MQETELWSVIFGAMRYATNLNTRTFEYLSPKTCNLFQLWMTPMTIMLHLKKMIFSPRLWTGTYTQPLRLFSLTNLLSLPFFLVGGWGRGSDIIFGLRCLIQQNVAYIFKHRIVIILF